MLLLVVTFFGSLSLAALAWDKSSSKLAAFLTGLVSGPTLVTLGTWSINGFDQLDWGIIGRDNLLWGLGIGILNGWFVGQQLGRDSEDD